MKTKLFSTIVAIALILFLGSCANDDIAQQPAGTGDIPTDEATFEAAPAAPTRTTMSNTGAFKWQSGDKIWVKDDTGAWRQSSNAPTSETASFKFKVPGTFTASSTYTVYYPGNGGNQDQVTISASQSQTDPDAPAHVGESGDCGWATATAASGTKRFNFTLDHKAAFLVFSPYCSNNTVLNSSDVKLTKIEVTSDNDLVGTYTLDPANATNPLTGTGSGKQINLTTTGGSATPNGFSVPTAATPATNASYVVIKPGTHTLKVRFWLKDYTTNVEGTVTKLYPSFTYAANTYYSMASSLTIKDYDGLYYMWDGQVNYWNGHEWNSADPWQPTVLNGYNSNYPGSGSPVLPGLPYQNTVLVPFNTRYDAIYSCASCPNINELSWFVIHGDPHWDDDELWTTMGHLYKGGMWIKTRKKIVQENSSILTSVADMKEKDAYGSDTRHRTLMQYVSGMPINKQPDITEMSDYFYLPALGTYSGGYLREIGEVGFYWSSSARSLSNVSSFSLFFTKTGMRTGDDSGSGTFTNRGYGLKAWTF